MKNDPNRNDLDWLALRYIAGELSEGEAADFEELLARDQSAREAVASAVQLTNLALVAEHQAAKSVSAVDNASPMSAWQRRAVWFAGGVAASLALFLFFAESWRRTGTDAQSATAASPDSARNLALAWVQTRSDLDRGVEASDVRDLAHEVVADVNMNELGIDEPDDSNNAEPPSWMVRAVVSLVDGGESSAQAIE